MMWNGKRMSNAYEKKYASVPVELLSGTVPSNSCPKGLASQAPGGHRALRRSSNDSLGPLVAGVVPYLIAPDVEASNT